MFTDTTCQIRQRKCRNIDEIPSPVAPEIVFSTTSDADGQWWQFRHVRPSINTLIMLMNTIHICMTGIAGIVDKIIPTSEPLAT